MRPTLSATAGSAPGRASLTGPSLLSSGWRPPSYSAIRPFVPVTPVALLLQQAPPVQIPASSTAHFPPARSLSSPLQPSPPSDPALQGLPPTLGPLTSPHHPARMLRWSPRWRPGRHLQLPGHSQLCPSRQSPRPASMQLGLGSRKPPCLRPSSSGSWSRSSDTRRLPSTVFCGVLRSGCQDAPVAALRPRSEVC